MTKPIIKIEYSEDTDECEVCGTDFSSGCVISLWDGDKQLWEIGEEANAHCFYGVDVSVEDLIEELLNKLGYEVEQSFKSYP